MARITIEADTPQQLAAFLRNWLMSASPQGDAENITKAIGDMHGSVTRAFVKDVSEATLRDGVVILDAGYAKRHGKDDPGQLGGAIARAWVSFGKHVGRPVLRADNNPRRYWMTKEDAEQVLAALKKLMGD
jgi:hypothetical protein